MSSAWLQPGVTWGAGTRVVVQSDQVRYRQSLLSVHTHGRIRRTRQAAGLLRLAVSGLRRSGMGNSLSRHSLGSTVRYLQYRAILGCRPDVYCVSSMCGTVVYTAHGIYRGINGCRVSFPCVPSFARCVAVGPGLSNPNPLTPWAAAHTIAAIASQPPPRVHTRASAHAPNTCPRSLHMPQPRSLVTISARSRHDLVTISSRPRARSCSRGAPRAP